MYFYRMSMRVIRLPVDRHYFLQHLRLALLLTHRLLIAALLQYILEHFTA